MAEYLLHSLSEFSPILEALLSAIRPRRVVEVGVESGCMSTYLIDALRPWQGEVVSIDPSLDKSLDEQLKRGHRILREKSVEALAKLDAADLYLLDGDHNYYTVRNELELIDRAAGEQFPLVILHDVRWPCGRRDLYYAPDTIPEAARNGPVYRGVVRGQSETVEGGFNGAGDFAFASWEGGPCNGVQTAIDDFLEGRPHLRYRVIPVIFGLGILFDGRSSVAERIEEVVAPYHDNPFLARMEENRLDLYLRVLELQEILIAQTEQADL